MLACLLGLAFRHISPLGKKGTPFLTIPHAALAARVVGTAEADRLALSGAMLAPDEALRVGLVDQVVPRDGLMVGFVDGWC